MPDPLQRLVDRIDRPSRLFRRAFHAAAGNGVPRAGKVKPTEPIPLLFLRKSPDFWTHRPAESNVKSAVTSVWEPGAPARVVRDRGRRAAEGVVERAGDDAGGGRAEGAEEGRGRVVELLAVGREDHVAGGVVGVFGLLQDQRRGERGGGLT